MKRHERRLFIAGSFSGDINKLKRQFWTRPKRADKLFDSIVILNSISKPVFMEEGETGFSFYPTWLCQTPPEVKRFLWGLWAFVEFFIKSPSLLRDALVLEYKTMPREHRWKPAITYRIVKMMAMGICGLGQVRNILHKYKITNKDIIVVWSEHLTGMRLLKNEVQRKGGQLVFSEYGELPGTTFICDRGMFHEAWPVVFKQFFKSRTVGDGEVLEMKKYISTVTAKRKSNKVGQYTRDDVKETLELSGEKPVIYVNGVQSHCSGLFPRCSEYSKEYSPYFASNDSILEYFAKLAIKHDWIILYKDHPNTYNYFPSHTVRVRNWGEHVRIVGNVDIYDVLKASDLTVSLGSKTVFLSLLSQVPVYLLGPYSIDSRDLRCGVYSGELSEESILKALKSARCEGVDEEGFATYLTGMMKYYYYSISDDTDIPFSRGKQQFWMDFTDYVSGARSLISDNVIF